MRYRTYAGRLLPAIILITVHAICPAGGQCGTVPYPSNTGHVTPDAIINSADVWSFVSEPHLHPMKVTVTTLTPAIAPGFIFVAPYSFSADPTIGQGGSLIMDNLGNPIWFRPLEKNIMNTDFRVQYLCGKPVLTFWQGTLATPLTYTNAPGGSSEPGSCYYVLDQNYRVIKTVSAQRGFISDIHEFLLTPHNTALLLSTKTVPIDLTPFGGSANGFVQDFAIQEIDLRTNNLIFFWDALEHIPLSDSFESASSATRSSNIWDAYHLNAIGLTDCTSDILVSGRNTSTIYRIHKPTGQIIWRLGGKQSSFSFGPGATFSWQHDSRFLPPSSVSLFDDNCCASGQSSDGIRPSRGLILQLDLRNMTARLQRNYFHDPVITVESQGNVQSLPNGNKFIGWGQSAYFSEYSWPGNTIDNPVLNTVYAAQMPGNNYTYRAYRHKWVGCPYYPPSIAVQQINNTIIVYASWNGSTETAAWQVYTGSSLNQLVKIKTVFKTGFETAIPVCGSGPYFQVKAVNCHGCVIGASKIEKFEGEAALRGVLCQKYN